MRVPWLGDVLRAAGLTVIEVAGWRGRGRELGGIDGVVAHHTATGPRTSDQAVANLLRLGRPDLAGPLSQLGLDRQGRYWLIADGKANHNGYGEWGNDSLGIEAYNDGVGEPWPAVQVDAYQRGAAAILTQIGLPASRVKGHKETDPTRKIDPAGIDMDTFRARVADLMAGDDDMTEEQARMLQQIHEATLGKPGGLPNVLASVQRAPLMVVWPKSKPRERWVTDGIWCWQAGGSSGVASDAVEELGAKQVGAISDRLFDKLTPVPADG